MSDDRIADGADLKRGPVAWLVQNRVTPNLAMLFLLLGGLFMSTRIKQEVFPEFSRDMVNISVAYPGASPSEVEQGVVLAVEEAVRGIEGVKEVRATAAEGRGVVNVELLSDADQQKTYQDIRQEVDRIITFPEDAEEPQVSLDVHRHDVMTVTLYGAASEWALRNLAEEVRDRLLQDPRITQVALEGVRDFEVRVAVPREKLRAYNLTLDGIARKIAQTAVDIPGGGVKTGSGEILVRFRERREWANEFARIPIVTTASGAVLRLGDIATVRDDFADTDEYATFNGKRAIGVAIYRVGDETPIGVADAAREDLVAIARDFPTGVTYAIRSDHSQIYRQRLHLLLKNAFFGLCVVLLVLGLFLEFKLAFWVTMGIPTSFLGGLLFLPGLGVSINMISLFAFIIALGIVVDDAIVAGENIYEYRQRGMSPKAAAVRGARDVSIPIAFSILTNIVAFLPLLMVPGVIGKIWRVIPLVVITVFTISWFEALFILPSHLAHTKSRPGSRPAAWLHDRQQAFARQVARFINGVYAPFLDRVIRWRFLTMAIGFALLFGVLGYVRSGRIGMILMPRVESDRAVVTAVLPYGSPLNRIEVVRDRLVAAAEKVAAENGGDRLSEGVYAVLRDNQVMVSLYLTDPDVRPLRTTRVTQLWREETGTIPGLESLKFQADRGGPGSGAAVTVELSHRDIHVLDRASTALADQLAGFPVVKDIDDGYTPGKQQLDYQLTAEGRSLGLTSQDVARQVRNAFYGAEALRQQRGRNEVRVMVQLPEAQRVSEYDVESFLVRTPSGRDVPLREVARVTRGRAYTSIDRRNGRRTIQVSADVDPISETGRILASLNTSILPQLARDYPGLSYSYEGRQADMKESMRSLYGGFGLTLLAVYFLLAIPFRSYSEPLIVMLAIPFGIVGAVLGHVLMGYSLSVTSMMGIVALAGVVVNDSLVLIDYANGRRADGESAREAVHQAGVRRFRPIILTTMTTFGGLAPMIFEQSRQARFMIPMAVSLGYGIVFGTLISLVLVPCLYVIVQDILGLVGVRSRFEEPAADVAPDAG